MIGVNVQIVGRVYLLDSVVTFFYNDNSVVCPTITYLLCRLQLPGLVRHRRTPLGEVFVDEHSVSMVFVVFFQSSSRAVDGVAHSLRAEAHDHRPYARPPFSVL